MSGGACQKAAQQANDVLAQQAKRDEDCGCGGGCAPAPALGKRDASRPKKGSNRRGPGCKNADCNACAEQADEVMNAVAGFSDGIPEFSFADVQRARLLAGFRPGVGPDGWGGASAHARPSGREVEVGGMAGCGDCRTDIDALCAENFGDAVANPGADETDNRWWVYDGLCWMRISCSDSTPLCDCDLMSEDEMKTACNLTAGQPWPDGSAGSLSCTYVGGTKPCSCILTCPEGPIDPSKPYSAGEIAGHGGGDAAPYEFDACQGASKKVSETPVLCTPTRAEIGHNLNHSSPGAGASASKPKPCTEANSKMTFLEASGLAESTCQVVLARLEVSNHFDTANQQLRLYQNPAVWYDRSLCCWMVDCVFQILSNPAVSRIANGCD